MGVARLLLYIFSFQRLTTPKYKHQACFNARVIHAGFKNLYRSFHHILLDAINEGFIPTVTDIESAKILSGMLTEPGKIYIAPGGKHLVLTEKDNNVHIELSDSPAENFCKPAVDPLFRSASHIYQDKLAGVVLTGMGADGCEGAKSIVSSGGVILSQDEDSSVVWGMPGAVAKNNVTHGIMSIKNISMTLNKWSVGEKK